jgi:sugar lactone lactonase YvrE
MRRWNGSLHGFREGMEKVKAWMAKMTVSGSNRLFWRRMNHFLPCLVLLMLCIAADAQTATQKNVLARFQTRADGTNLVEATGTVLSRPSGLVFDAAGNLYIADRGDNQIIEVSPVGLVTTVAGTGEQGYSGDNGAATMAQLDSPSGVAVDAAGSLYIADTHNNRIRKVTSGIITTIAGTGVAGFSGDSSAATSATLNLPSAIAVDAGGNLYIADTNNHRIRKVSGTTIATVAGDGEQLYLIDGVLATQAGLDSPSGIAVDALGNLYIGDTHNQRIRKVTQTSGLISTLAGNGTKSFSGDGGIASSAALATPRGVTAAADGSIYLADSDNQRIRNISASGTISTAAGDGEQGFSGDTGPANQAVLDTPHAVAAFSSGVVAIADTNNQRVRMIFNGSINTAVGLGNNGSVALVLSGVSPVVTGNGSLTATLLNGASTATGTVTFLDVTSAASKIGTASLSNNTATVNLGSESAGTHRFVATYAGDALNPAVSSGIFLVVVNPAPVPNNFSIAATTATQNVIPGGSANYLFTLTPQSGTFGSGVTLAIAGLPSGATASFAPASIAAGASGAVSTTLMVQTAKLAASLNNSSHSFPMPLMLCLLSLPFLSGRRTRGKMRAIALANPVLLLLLLVGAATLSGCGSGIGFFAQPQKSYTLTVTATSAAAAANPSVSQSTTVTLIVQ